MSGERKDIASRARLRGMRRGDGRAMARLHRRAIMAVPDISAADRESWALGIAPDLYETDEKAGGATFLLAEIGDTSVGFVGYGIEGTTGLISGLYVDPDWQGHGIARRLTERAEAILRGRGAERMRVRASASAIVAYQAMGFRQTGRGSHQTRGGRDVPMIEMEKPLGGDWRNFYGRRHGKKLRDSQKAALSRLAHLSPGPVTREENPERRPLDLSRFGGAPIWLEVGFGGGEHLVHQAERNPDVHLVGAEPFVNGVAMLLSKIESAGLRNVSVHAGDARDLIEVLPDASIARVFLLYPDPWPKRRHHRRRFVTAEHLAPLARVMMPGAEFRLATDIPDYVRQAREEVPQHGFVEETEDERRCWPDWIRTRYEAKALREGRRPHYLTFRRG